MPTWDLGLRARWENDDTKVLQALDELKTLNGEIENAKQKHQEAAAAANEQGSALGNLAGKVAGYIAAFVGIEKIIGWLKQGTEESITQERALLQLSNTAKAFGLDGAAAAKAAKDLAESLATKGFEETETIKTMEAMLPLTKSYQEAVNATTLVTEIAISRGNVPYAQSLTIIRDLVAGTPRSVREAQRAFGTEIGKTSQEILNNLVPAMAKEAVGIHDTKMEVDSATAKWHELWKELGDRVTPVLRWLAENILPTMIVGLKSIPTAIEDVKERFVMWVNLLSKVDLKHPIASLGAALAQYNTDELTFAAHSEARWTKLGNDLDDYKKKLAEPPPGTGERIKSHGAEKPGAIGPPDAEDNADAEAWMDWRAKIWQEIAAQDLKAAADRRAAKLKGIKDDEKAEQDSANKVDKIHAELTNKYKHWTVAELADKIAELKKIEMDEATSALTRKQIAADLAAFKKMLDGLVAENAAEKQKMAVESALSAAAGAFPQIKELASAEAIMNTYQAATKALAEGGPYLGPVLAAVITLAGLANVAKIESTEPGGSGGGGAAGGGVTMPSPTFVTPAQSAPSSQSTTTVTTHAPQQTIININAIDTTDALRSLQRKFLPAQRSYNRTIISRGPVEIGSRRPR
jgi:hypothetical protein